MPSATVEDYVKAIYLAEQELAPGANRGRRAGGKKDEAGGSDGTVALGQLAARMRVVPGTATAMVKALAEAGLVRYESRKGVRLSEGGEKLALRVLRRHRLIELFLVRVLELDWSEVHEEAEALEHALSDKVVDRLDKLLGHPAVDPHGDPIPSVAGKIRAEQSQALLYCGIGDLARVVRVDNRDPEFLRYAERNGLLPGAVLRITQREAQSGTMTLSLGGAEQGARDAKKDAGKAKAVTIGDHAAARIYVSL